MFYHASKILWVLAQPSNLLIAAFTVGVLALGLGWSKLARWLLYPATAALALIGLLPVGQWLLLPLENRFPAAAPAAPVDGIVVLGGGINVGISEGRGRVAFENTGERFITLIELARCYPDARLIFTGGLPWLSEEGLTEAAVMRRFASDHGIASDRVIFEDQARNTHDNAVLSKALAAPVPGERWLLVTSASHMPRAVGVFRGVGWPVIPYPVDYRTRGELALFVIPDAARRWSEFDQAIRSWTGLLAYWWSGRIDSPFPAP
jgi:uncharacterized SAM-binding protein YcdF (DUF218 family)